MPQLRSSCRRSSSSCATILTCTRTCPALPDGRPARPAPVLHHGGAQARARPPVAIALVFAGNRRPSRRSACRGCWPRQSSTSLAANGTLRSSSTRGPCCCLARRSPRGRAEVYVRLADMKVAQQRRREAIVSYRKALSVQPTHDGCDARAGRRASRGGRPSRKRSRCAGSCWSSRRSRSRGSACSCRFPMIASELATTRATMEALEAARAISPEDTAVLARLAQVYDAAREYLKVVEIKVSIARLKTQPEEVARSLVIAADFARERADAFDRALEIYQAALDADPLDRACPLTRSSPSCSPRRMSTRSRRPCSRRHCVSRLPRPRQPRPTCGDR